MRPPDLPGGNDASGPVQDVREVASMRPPDLPGGNALAGRRGRAGFAGLQ